MSSGGRGGRERRCVCVKRVECVLRVLARRACDGQFLRRVLVCEESVERERREVKRVGGSVCALRVYKESRTDPTTVCVHSANCSASCVCVRVPAGGVPRARARARLPPGRKVLRLIKKKACPQL